MKLFPTYLPASLLTLFFSASVGAGSIGDIPGGAGHEMYSPDPATWTIASGSTGSLTFNPGPVTVCNGTTLPSGFSSLSADAVTSRTFPTPGGTKIDLEIFPCITPGSGGNAVIFLNGDLIFFQGDEIVNNPMITTLSYVLTADVHDLTLAISEDQQPGTSSLLFRAQLEYPVPEPGTMILLGVGVLLLMMWRQPKLTSVQSIR